MKYLGKESVVSFLKITINVALVIQTLIFIFAPIIFVYLLHDLSKGFAVCITYMPIIIGTTAYNFLTILILLQLRNLLKTFTGEAFFAQSNIKSIRFISLFLFLQVICNFISSLNNPKLITPEFVSKINEYIPFPGLLLKIFAAIDYKLLFFSVVIYLVSLAFEHGYELKEQSNLTI